jgi:hypothetical protein
VTAVTGSANRRPSRRVWFPETLDPNVEIAAALVHFRFDVRLRYGEHISVDLAGLGRPDLLRPFVETLWRICQIGGPAGARSTAMTYVNAVRRFWAFLDDRHLKIRRPEDLAPAHVNDFEIWLRDGRHSDITAYQIMARLTACLRVMHEERPGAISENLFARLRHVASHYYGKSRPRDAYSDRVASSLREASRREVLAIHQRVVVAGEKILRDGPAKGDAGTRSAYRMIMERIVQDGTIPCSLQVYKSLYLRRREAGVDNATLIDDLHGHLYLSASDVVPFLVLLSLETGIEIECCKGLTTNCLKNPTAGSVEIEYCKRRARGAEWHRLRVRDGSSGTPGGLVRMILRLTDRARRFLNSDSLWCYYRHNGLTADIGHPGDVVLAAFISRNGILDDDAQPAKLVLSRLRKTHKAEWYRRTNGQMEQFAVGHTAEVAANHYADIPALRPFHEAAVAAGLQDALDATLPIRIVPPRLEARMRKAPAKADLPVPPAEVIAFLDGAQDLWLASCGGFYASPFGAKGRPCPVPFWGCLDCGNAVITSRKLPALIAFLTFMVAQRETLQAADWAAKFGRAHRRVAEQILPAFPAAVVAAARTVAESQAGLLHLPPEASA